MTAHPMKIRHVLCLLGSCCAGAAVSLSVSGLLSSHIGSMSFNSRDGSEMPRSAGFPSATRATSFLGRTITAYTADPAELVKFELYTRQEPTSPTRLFARDGSTVLQSSYDPSKPTKVLIHGWLSHQGPGTGGDALKNAFLATQDCNVITVDWSDADTKLYGSAVRLSVPRVAAETAELIRLLSGLGAQLDDFHILGHSLGGHIAGEAGSQTLGPANAGRITGLDPAGPYFEGKDPTQRLDWTDAGFVDILHTDGGYLGYAGPIGHADFFPNGGMHVQPGCGRDRLGLCSHCLAYDFYVDALVRPGARVYKNCDSWQSYQEGSCNAGEAVIGTYTERRSRGSYFSTADIPIRENLLSVANPDVRKLISGGLRPPGLDGVAYVQC